MKNTSTEPIARLTEGQRFRAQITGKVRGERVYCNREFVAARDQDVEHFIVGRDGTPDQDRVFTAMGRRRGGTIVTTPTLIVAGSIEVIA